jgi:Flp pilus assembly protein TadD
MNRKRIAWATLTIALALVAGQAPMTAPPETVSRLEHQRQMQQLELRQRFEQAVVMLHAHEYEHAITALHRVLELAPEMPEAHVNMGYALLGLQRADAARGFFEAAIALRPGQANAYYGLAMADELRQDYQSALGGMRSYLHLSKADDPHRVRARAALWEWEEKLGRHDKAGSAGAAPATGALPDSGNGERRFLPAGSGGHG